jgi:hypothetical protein
MPNPERTPQEMLERAGRALYGEDWQRELTMDLGIRGKTVRQWLSGHLRLRPDHFETLLALMAKRRTQIEEAEQEVRTWLAQQPREERT